MTENTLEEFIEYAIDGKYVRPRESTLNDLIRLRNHLNTVIVEEKRATGVLKAHLICKRGHPLDADNVVMYGDGQRRCLICRNAMRMAQQARGSLTPNPELVKSSSVELPLGKFSDALYEAMKVGV